MKQEEYVVSTIENAIQQIDKEALSGLNLGALIESPKDEKLGDAAFPCFLLARSLKKSPAQIATDLAEIIKQNLDPKWIAQVQNVGPYINFKYNTSQLAETIITANLENKWVSEAPRNHKKMMIEYSQPNTHKAFHVGHTRNVALGDALSRLCQWAGFDVTAVNYIGDVGTHIARCLWYFKKHHSGDVPKNNLGEFLGDMYVKATDMLDFKNLTEAPHVGIISAEVKEITDHPSNDKWKVVKVFDGSTTHQVVCGGTGYKVGDVVAYAPVGQKVSGREVSVVDKKGVESVGVLCSEKEISISDDKNKIYTFKSPVTLGAQIANLLAKKDIQISCPTVVEEMEERSRQVSDILKKLESGEPELTSLWNETKKWSMDEFHDIYSWLGAHFDHYFFESDVAELGKKIVKENFEKGIFIKSEGAVGADLSEYKLPFFLLLKSDGTGLYSTKDIALAELKFTKYKIDHSVYVVDDGQSLHFQQVFATLKKLNFKNAENCYHLAYGKVERPDGKMSSRKGNVILFSTLKKTLTDKIKNDYLEKYIGQWSPEEIESAARCISLATIRYGMLNQDSVKNITFDLDEWTARSGNTGPYMMYAYARIQSMLNDAQIDLSKQEINFSALQSEQEHQLLMQISRFRSVIHRAVTNYEPHLVCFYMYQLAKEFSSFYSQCPVLKAETEDLKIARLALCEATAKTLKKSLELVGIPTIDRM